MMACYCRVSTRRQKTDSQKADILHWLTGNAVTPMVCPRIVSTDLDALICKIHLALGVPGVAAQRMTSVAWKRSVGGMVRPSAWAVLRLITSSNVVGCSIGRSVGLMPLRILST